MEKNNKYEKYLMTLGKLLRNKSLKIAKKRKKIIAIKKNNLISGQTLAWYTIITLMQQQAESFNIDLSEISLDNINADKDLL